ncbi:MAG: mannose-1-phosphate guanylyltransferase [Akkermansia sp.]|nr:mannose-1-phosphate guanylyltransferase [Akkermansia sp.]
MKPYALILAGGSGTRFWPLSRDKRPKQLQKLLGGTSLMCQAIQRLQGLIPTENIFILTNQIQEEEVRLQAPGIPADNIITEPIRRDTAPAIALGIGLIKAANPNAVMMVIPSDQLIRDEQAFRLLMQDALETASVEDALITVGIKPSWPCPSYGYIERGSIISTNTAHPCHEVIQFREKPDVATATTYLERGNFCWNAGMFVWSIPTVCRQLEKHCPELANFVETIAEANNPQATITEHFHTLTPISIDFALMEKADKVLNFEASFDWDDVGSWISVSNYLESVQNNQTNTDITVEQATGNIVFSQSGEKHIALLGVENLIIVETSDAILIADKSKADDIKKIVSQLPEELR